MDLTTLWTVLSVLGALVVTTSFWYGLYEGLRRKFALEGEYTTRIVAASHAILCVILAYLCFKGGANPLYEQGQPNTNLQVVTMLISAGYFIYDFVWCLKFQPDEKIMLLHHFASIFAMCYIIVIGESGAEAIGGLGSLEITNPLLQARWFLRYYHMKGTVIFWIVEYAFFAMFMSVRLVYGSSLLYAVLMTDKTNFVVKLITISLYLISLAFIGNIMRIVYRRISRTSTIPTGPLRPSLTTVRGSSVENSHRD